jgi:hypothetical protein
LIGIRVDGTGGPIDPWEIMNSDPSPPWSQPSGSRSDSVRRQVVDAAAELMRRAGASEGSGYSDGPSTLNLYLALLTDRLPVYARTMKDLDNRVGKATVAENLTSAAMAAIRFYTEILATKVSIFSKPEQLVQLRDVLKAHKMGPHSAQDEISAYLEKERAIGRVAEDVHCAAAAQLLIGASVNYAFTKLLLDDVMPREAYVAEIVEGLRLTPRD